MRPALPLIALLLTLPGPAAHAAATVSAISHTVTDPDGVSTSFGVLAIGDKADDELATQGIYGNFGVALGTLVTDPAGVVAAEGCEQLDPTTARCMVPENQQGLATVTATLSGGAGDDVLHAGDIARALFGGPGRDHLWAGSRHDLLKGGSGADLFSRVGRGDTVRARDRRRDVVRCRQRPLHIVVDRVDVLRGCGRGTM